MGFNIYIYIGLGLGWKVDNLLFLNRGNFEGGTSGWLIFLESKLWRDIYIYYNCGLIFGLCFDR